MQNCMQRQEKGKMEFQEGICKFCLEKCESCKAVEGNTKNILCILLPNIDFTLIQEPVTCRNCAEMLIKCYNFKAKCLHTYKSIISLVKKNSVKLNLIDVYLSKNATGTGISEGQDICGFCLGPTKNVSAVSLTVEKEGNILGMIKRCLPELDLSIIEKLVMCAPCLGSLENCYHFVTNCLILEEKKCFDTLALDCKGKIELSNVLQFTKRYVRHEVNVNSVDKIKAEPQFYGDTKSSEEKEIDDEGGIVKSKKTFLVDFEHTYEDVKIENETFMEMNHKKDDNEHRFTPENMLALQEESYSPSFIKTEGLLCEENEAQHKGENIAEMEDQKCFLNEDVEIKTEEISYNRFEDSFIPQREVNTSFHREQKCLMPNLEENLTKPYIEETLTNKSISTITMHKCNLCSYQTKHKYVLSSHLLTHKDPSEVTMYKCDTCLYQTKHKRSLKMHFLTHKDPSEVTMYRCDTCLYQTNRKDNLKKHLLRHKDPSEITMYKCDTCLYQTKFRNGLKRHLLKHKDPSEVTMYQCTSCLYQTKRKDDLKLHCLKHKDPSEVTMHKCDVCLFQTKFRKDLKAHLLRHKDPSEIPVYKCEFCSYQINRRDSLNKHLLKHRDPSEVTTYNCDTCSYETKIKNDLKRHLLRHKDPSEVTMYKCASCLYQTKRKNDLKFHCLNHKDPSEIMMHKCDICLFQTKFRKHLKAHSLKHKDSSEVTMYKCDSCSYQTRFKSALRTHLRQHKDPSEVTVYKCELCLYKTKFKGDLKTHSLRHKNPSEIMMYKCDSCTYQTKHKHGLKVHSLKHKTLEGLEGKPCPIHQSSYYSQVVL